MRKTTRARAATLLPPIIAALAGCARTPRVDHDLLVKCMEARGDGVSSK